MASLFDDWEGTSSARDDFDHGGVQPVSHGGGASQAQFDGDDGYSFDTEKSTRTTSRGGGGGGGASAVEEESSIFSLAKVDWNNDGRQGRGRRTVVSGSAGNDVLVMGTTGCVATRWNSSTHDIGEMEQIAISKTSGDNIHKVFVNPSGNLVVVALDNDENFFLLHGQPKPKKLPKLSQGRVECVAWDSADVAEGGPVRCLMGTRLGHIFQVLFDGGGKVSAHRVYKLSSSIPIQGLCFEKFPTRPTEPTKYFVMAVTAQPARHYQFVGGPTFEELFREYESGERLRFSELPHCSTDYSELHFFSRPSSAERATSFAMLTGKGVFHGKLQFGSQCPGDNVIVESAYRTCEAADHSKPVSLAVTEFHFLLLFHNRLQVISRLSDKVVWDKSIGEECGKALGLARDATLGTLWLYTELTLFQIAVVDEDRDVWQLYLERAKNRGEGGGEFATALEFCKTPAQKDQVLTAQAEHLFAQGDFELAAQYFARTRLSFEAVALRFVDREQRGALKVFLLQKLKGLRPHDKTQITIICTWLTELYLDRYIFLQQSEDVEAHAQLLTEFQQFLEDHKEHLNPATTFDLISSHGRVMELLFYASIIEDFERVITHYIHEREHDNAIDALRSAPFAKVEQLYYKFSPVLMLYEPAQTVQMWQAAVGSLDSCKLIPALVRYNQQREALQYSDAQPPHRSSENFAIRYLEFVVEHGNKDAAIHNYLIALYASQEDEEPLLTFLRSQRGGRCSFDLRYALRVCMRRGRTTACVHIYSMMRLYEEAVNLALQVDVELAKENASQPEDDELRKKLWLLIAKHTIDISDPSKIKEAITILKECDLLKIEDILPFFPDFVVIDDFKKEICQSLEEYNGKIERLKQEMEEYTQSADLIRTDIKQLRRRFGEVGPDDVCMLSGKPITSGAYYIFPSGYAYLVDELKREMLTRFNARDRQLALELLDKLRLAAESGDDARKDQLQQQVDDMFASECPLTGQSMIDTIDMPFLTQQDEEEPGWQL